MKFSILLLLITIVVFNSAFSQSTFFYYGTNHGSGISYTQIEHNGSIFIGGGYSNTSMNYYDFYIGKFDSAGNISKEYIGAFDTINKAVFDFKIYNDTILRAFINYYGEPDQRIMVCDFDFNLNLIGTKSFHLRDSIMIFSKDNVVDKNGNYVICGIYANSPYYPPMITFLNSFLFKISENLDSLKFFYKETSPHFTSIDDEPLKQTYSVSTQNQFIEYYDYNLQLIKSLTADSMLFEIYDHMYLAPNKILITGEGLNQTELVKHVVLKTLDTLGNKLQYIEISFPDTPATPGIGSMLTYDMDSSFLYLVFHKNNNKSTCNGGEASYIGVGKYDLNLNQQWLRFYGNGSFNYRPLDCKSTSDGGLIVTGYYEDCTGMNYFSNEFLLKVDSLGECTFMKELPFSVPNITVYPNPATTQITLGLGAQNQKIELVNIFTVAGQKALILNNVQSNEPIDVQSLKPGIYLLEGVLESGERFVGKFVKE